MKTTYWRRQVVFVAFLVLIMLVSSVPAFAQDADYIVYCPARGWGDWQEFRITQNWTGAPGYPQYRIVEFRPEMKGNHQIEFSGPITGAVRVSASWIDGSGRKNNFGSWRLWDKTLDLQTGSPDIYYNFFVAYEPNYPTVGVSAKVEYRVRCRP